MVFQVSLSFSLVHTYLFILSRMTDIYANDEIWFMIPMSYSHQESVGTATLSSSHSDSPLNDPQLNKRLKTDLFHIIPFPHPCGLFPQNFCSVWMFG